MCAHPGRQQAAQASTAASLIARVDLPFNGGIIISRTQRKPESGPSMPTDPVQLSKFMSLVLRHKPDAIALALDPHGWASIDELIEKGNAAGTKFDRDDLLHVVETSDKKRFSLSTDGLRVRAAQGHSVSVELGLLPQQPPPVLYHGTATRFVTSILSEGLKPQARQHVHLSIDEPQRSASVSVMASPTSSRSTPSPCTLRASSSTSQTMGYG